MPRAHPYFDVPSPMILGHRGAAAHAPENTLLSFETAIALGADAIESDVQVTADGIPVLLHDCELARVTGSSGPVDTLRLSELKQLDAGHHFSIDDRGDVDPTAPKQFRGQGLRVPTLAEAFEAFPTMRFNLEIKTAAQDVVRRVVELVAKLGREPITLLAAGDDEIMAELRRELASQNAEIATSASVSEIVAVVRSAVAGEPPPREVMALQIPTNFAGRPLVTQQLLSHAHTHGIAVHVWTINAEEEMQQLLDQGVDGLVTDFPGRLASLAAARRSVE